MAIDRTAYNALVNDDGSNTVGSIWDKNAIKNVLLDPIDAAFVPPVWVGVAFNAANFTTNAGSWTVDAGDQQLLAYRIFGKTLSLKFSLINTTVSGSPAELRITLPAGAIVALGNQYGPLNYFDGAAHGLSTMAALVGASVLRLQRDTYGVGTWPASTNAASFVGAMDIIVV